MAGIFDVLGVVFKPIADYFGRRQEIKAQEHENELKTLEAQGERQAELFKTGLAADAAWEQTFATQAATSWKDEFELMVVSTPAILCFFPGGAPIVAAGFVALGTTPPWYQFLFVSIYLANYGIRYWRKTQSDT